MPSEQPTGRLHCDGDYGHSAEELNVWLPVTPAFGGNSLWCESTPGVSGKLLPFYVSSAGGAIFTVMYCHSVPAGRFQAGDFAPFELAHGEAKLFWGARCRHHTVPNDSGAARVSLDFRVLPSSRFEAEPPSADGRSPRFQVGGFYGAMGAGGVVSG